MDTDQWDYPPRDLRLSDADRDWALAELSEHFQPGRLTAGELDDRSGRILRVRTSGELADVLADLPRDVAVLPTPGRGRWLFSLRIIVAVVIVIAVVSMFSSTVTQHAQRHGHSGGSHSTLTIVVPVAIALLVLCRKRGGGPGRR